MDISRALYLDDRDSSIIYYSMTDDPQVWTNVPGAAGFEFMGTTTVAEVAGAAANITFTGSDITVLGTISPIQYRQPPSVTFTLDETSPYTFQPAANNDSQPQYNVTFYQSSGQLGTAPHTLRIVTKSAGAFWLDCIVIRGSPTVLSVAPTSSTADTASTSQGTPAPKLPNSTATSASSHGAVIASGILGGVLFLGLLFGSLYFFHHRRNSRVTKSFDAPEDPGVIQFHGNTTAGTIASATSPTSGPSSLPRTTVTQPRTRESKQRASLGPHRDSPPAYSNPIA
ncbi:hypothetical protein D9756_004940 [Leucocoprinus leucothites]|uniref:Uncharacterized protein n=1 Tax=Leucocoprinus leucothites TaxID=201217 RepID=A0A8H5G9S8_9AGAR|nr:hypothetical protein D9756_004940 [Leucoagaricus leucothites]